LISDLIQACLVESHSIQDSFSLLKDCYNFAR